MRKSTKTTSGVPASLAPQPAATMQGSKEHRSVPRFYVKWRAIAFIDAKNEHHCFIKDISTKGAAIFLDRNLQSLEFIKLHIHIPPSHTDKAQRVIQVHGKIAYTVYDSKEFLFRVGIVFFKFESDHDPVFLETYLTKYQTKIV